MPDQPAKTTKRQVKNPETFRERAIKANQEPDKPNATTRVKSGVGKPISKVFAPVKRGGAKLFSVQPFKTVAVIGRFIGKILLPPYVRNSWKELKLVTWPTWKESYKLTFAVLVFAVVFGALVAAVDYGLDHLFRDILLK